MGRYPGFALLFLFWVLSPLLGSGIRAMSFSGSGIRDPGSAGSGIRRLGIRGPSSGSENSAGIRDPEPGSGIRKTSDELVVWLNTIIASLPDQCDVSILETECSTFQCFVEPTNSYIGATICTETPRYKHKIQERRYEPHGAVSASTHTHNFRAHLVKISTFS